MLQKITLAGNDYVGNGAFMEMGKSLQHSKLRELVVIAVPSVNDAGLRHIADIPSLRVVYLYHLLGVGDREKVLLFLQQSMPRCKVTFPKTDLNETIADVFKRKDL